VRPCLLPAVALLTLAVAACDDQAPTATPGTSSTPPPVAGNALDAGDDLAARATLALDKPFAALYSLDDGRGARDVVATTAADGTWRVDVSRGLQGGTTDISIVSLPTGVYQCTVATAANPITPACTRVAEKGKRVPAKYSPKVERLFRTALTVFTDRQSGLTVTEVQPLPGAKGTCYSIDSISASLDPPIYVGVYCYADDGVLTAARVDLGVLRLVSQVPGPPTVPLPGPDTGAAPMTKATPEPAAAQPPAVQPSGLTPPA
jgi:hypothetical protein